MKNGGNDEEETGVEIKPLRSYKEILEALEVLRRVAQPYEPK